MASMKWQSMLLLLGICLDQSAGVLRGQCSKCLPNNVACLNEREFATCLNGQITENLTRCPANSVCTAGAVICQSPDDGFRPVCFDDNCGGCRRTDGRFACLSRTSYGFCYGAMEPHPDSIRSCPTGTVCSVESPDVCVAEAGGGIASCDPTEEETTTEPPTTQAPAIAPDAFCASQKRTGYFKATDDPTCREYIYCFELAGQYLGNRYVCEGYFDAGSARCQTEKPIDC